MSVPAASEPEPATPPRRLKLLGDALETVKILFGLVAILAIAGRLHNGNFSFVGLDNAQFIAVQTATVALAALGMTVIIVSGGIDLSAGTALSLSATVLAWGLRADQPTLAVLACIAAGALCGLVNGVLVSTLRVVPFIVTLGTMTIYRGLGWMLAQNTPIRPTPDRVPAWLPALVRPDPAPDWLVFAPGVWLVLGLAVIVACILRLSVFGRHLFAIGSSEATARLCGVNVPGVKLAAYSLAGVLVGIAGLLQFAYLSSGNPSSGVGLELKIIAAVVIGGGSLSGGRGTVLGTLTGAVMMGVIAQGCSMLGLENYTQDIIIGAIIIAAVTLDKRRQQRLAA